MDEGTIRGVSHIGLCVADPERSRRFYTEGLGFEVSHSVVGKEPFDRISEVPGMELHATFLKRDGVMIELMHYAAPGVTGTAERRPMNQLGLTHMAYVVKDIDAVVERLVALGGRVYPHTRVITPAGDMIFCTDPDGIRLELWDKPE